MKTTLLTTLGWFWTVALVAGCGGRMDLETDRDAIPPAASGGATATSGTSTSTYGLGGANTVVSSAVGGYYVTSYYGNGGASMIPPMASGGYYSTTYYGSGGITAHTASTVTCYGSGGTTMCGTVYEIGSGGTVRYSSTNSTYVSPGGGYTSTSIGAGGAVTTSTTTPAYCSSSMDLVALAAKGEYGNWVGDDPSTRIDNPCGVQGAFYAYSDQGLDGINGTQDDTVQYPPIDTSTSGMRTSPCANGVCCISGRTTNWPIVNGSADYYANVWGGGIGLSLNDPGDGGSHLPYVGPAMGFVIAIAGSLNGQVLRIAYTQTEIDEAAPFVTVTSIGSFPVPFDKVVCPSWSSSCIAPAQNPYDLQIQVVGGDVAGAYKICVTSITPIF